MIIIQDYDNDCESGDPKMEYSDGGDDDTVMPVHYQYYHYFHQVILIMEYLDGGDDDYNYDS